MVSKEPMWERAVGEKSRATVNDLINPNFQINTSYLTDASSNLLQFCTTPLSGVYQVIYYFNSFLQEIWKHMTELTFSWNMPSKPLLTVTKWSLTPASTRHIKTGKTHLMVMLQGMIHNNDL